MRGICDKLDGVGEGSGGNQELLLGLSYAQTTEYLMREEETIWGSYILDQLRYRFLRHQSEDLYVQGIGYTGVELRRDLSLR